MKFSEMTNDNKDFTSSHDRAVAEVRKALGSYERIAQRVVVYTGTAIAGQTIRTSLQNRTLPLWVAAALVELMREEAPKSKVNIFSFFPALETHLEATGVINNDFLG